MYYTKRAAVSESTGVGFADTTIQDIMLFFLLIQFAIQLFAWSIIFGNLKMNDPANADKANLKDVEEETKNETFLPSYLCKVAYLEVHNFCVLLSYSITTLHWVILILNNIIFIYFCNRKLYIFFK